MKKTRKILAYTIAAIAMPFAAVAIVALGIIYCATIVSGQSHAIMAFGVKRAMITIRIAR